MKSLSRIEKLAIKDCVGCGFCCKKAPCGLALRIYGAVSKCPSLKWDAEKKRYWCKIIQHPIIGQKHKKELAIDEGCCCGLNSDRQNIPSPTEEETKVYSYELAKETKVLISNLSKQMVSSDLLWLTFKASSIELDNDQFLHEALFLAKQQRSCFNENFMG